MEKKIPPRYTKRDTKKVPNTPHPVRFNSDSATTMLPEQLY
jgi:hypothetical protein